MLGLFGSYDTQSYDPLGNAVPSKVVTEADFDLTVDFDSELEESLGPDFLKDCVDSRDSDYDSEAVNNIQERDYKDDEEEFEECINEGMQHIFGYHIESTNSNSAGFSISHTDILRLSGLLSYR